MSYFDDASLVMIPSGYKTSKVYSVKPTDGSGDLTFSRSNDTATRVGPNGIEKVRTNLALYSQDLSNAAYTGSGDSGYSLVTTANYTTAPDGTQTATRVQITRGSTYAELYQRKTIASGVEFTVSFWGKALSGAPTLSTAYNAAYFNLVTFTSEWVRYTYTTTSTGTALSQGFNLLTWSSLPTTSTSADVAIWGVQIETGVATNYIPTTSAAVSVGPVANVPRLDYLGSSCPRLLLEPQRTNLALFSEQFDNAYFSKFNAAINANALVSLDGYTNADKFVATATTGVHYLGIPVTSVNPAVLSVFAKAAEETVFAIGNATGSQGVVFNLSNGTITSGAGGAIENYGNGWYRCSYYRASWSDFQYFSLRGNVPSYTGNGTDGIYLYGVQFEVGAYATSYIPTLGASVTRGADAASKTGISSLIGQTEGTIFVDYTCDNSTASAFSRAIAISDGTGDNRIIFNDNVGVMSFFASKAGATQANAATSIPFTGTHKVAIAYANNDFKVYVDGVAVLTDTSFDVPACTALYVATYEEGTPNASNNKINQALVFKTRLTNAQLAELTTL